MVRSNAAVSPVVSKSSTTSSRVVATLSEDVMAARYRAEPKMSTVSERADVAVAVGR
jgi:hypothetical protein